MAAGGSGLLATQRNEMAELMKKQLITGETWYLIGSRWFKQWKKYVGYDEWDTEMVGDLSANPGPIDNSPILKEDKRTLLENLTEGIEYYLLPRDAWNKLVSWYTLPYDQDPIMRSVIEQGVFSKRTRVEVYLLQLKLCWLSDMSNVQTRFFSHASTVESLAVTMRQVFKISDSKDIRLWCSYASNMYAVLDKWDSTLQDSTLYGGQLIVIESRNDDGSWNRQIKITNVGTTYPTNRTACTSTVMDTGIVNSTKSTTHEHNNAPIIPSFYGLNPQKPNSKPGVCGLNNLGNTCFMNSAIQCLSNVPSLTKYMREDCWRKELNIDNLLGMGGEIATAYADLIKKMWSGRCNCNTPRQFKITVGRFKPEFSGNQQQDSQEFMAFLLDGLHEDLNRIKNKPYIETKEANGRSDEEVAKEAWADYIQRNNSVIVDTFHGLLKSTLICPECDKVSVKFDPFCYLSLPLPVKDERHIEVFLVSSDPMKKLCQFKVTVPRTGIVTHLHNALCVLTGIAPEKMVVVDVYNRCIHRFFSPGERISSISDRDDIFVYEIPVSEGHDLILVPVYMREDGESNGTRSCPTKNLVLFGIPFLVAVSRSSCTYDILYNCVLDRMVRYVRATEITPGWWKPSEKKQGDKSCKEGAGEANNGEDSDEPANNHNPKSKSEEEPVEKDDKDISDPEPCTKYARLFTFHGVSSSGNTDTYKINDDGKPIRFPNNPYVAAHWNAKAKRLFFDETKCEELVVDESMEMKPIPKKPEVKLANCLELFTTKERLGEHDPWFCPSCKKHQQATKKFDLWQLPRVLVIHLKRFSFTRTLRDKLDTFVGFPTRGLDMQPWIINQKHTPAVYDLIAVSNHYGGMVGGHYTAYAKNKDDGKWYNFDDASVSYVSEDSVVTPASYVLVYQMRTETSKVPSSSVKTQPTPTTVGSLHKGVTLNNSSGSDDDMETS